MVEQLNAVLGFEQQQKETCLLYAAELIQIKTKQNKTRKTTENLEVKSEIVSSEKAHGFSKINSSAAPWNTMQCSLL